MPQTICLAPGHGGFDAGAVGIGGLEEKNVNLAVSLALEKLLSEAGIHVVMTRTTDEAAGGASTVQEDLTNQCKIANDANVDLFFTIHCNAASVENAYGAEAWVFPSNAGAAQLAQKCVKALDPIVGTHGEPVKDGSRLWVIHDTAMPAVLVELGFVTSEKDAALLKDHSDKFAQALADVLIPHLGGTKPAPTPEPQQPTPSQPEPPVQKDDDSQYVTQDELKAAIDGVNAEIAKIQTQLQPPAPAPAPQPPSAKWSATLPIDVMNNGYYFMPQAADGQTGAFSGVGDLFQIDTGAFELLVTSTLASEFNLPNRDGTDATLGTQTIMGVTGNSVAYNSKITLKLGDRVFQDVPCIIDPNYQTFDGGLFGARFLNDNGLSLTVRPKAKTVTFEEE